MKNILLLCVFVLSLSGCATLITNQSLITEEVVFVGKSVESHNYSKPLTLKQIKKLNVPNANKVFEELNSSNSCGIQKTIYKVSEVLLGKSVDKVKVFDFLGEWCESDQLSAEKRIFHIKESAPFNTVLSYEFACDASFGLTVIGSKFSGMQFMGLSFSDHAISLSEPQYAGTAKSYQSWVKAIEEGEIKIKGDFAYFTSGIPISTVLESKGLHYDATADVCTIDNRSELNEVSSKNSRNL